MLMEVLDYQEMVEEYTYYPVCTFCLFSPLSHIQNHVINVHVEDDLPQLSHACSSFGGNLVLKSL